MIRGRKALCTTAMIIGLFMLVWLPYCVYEGTLRLLRLLELIYFNMQFHKVSQVLYLLTLFNSLIDPFIYALRMREVQRGSPLYNQSINNQLNRSEIRSYQYGTNIKRTMVMNKINDKFRLRKIKMSLKYKRRKCYSYQKSSCVQFVGVTVYVMRC